MLVHFRTLLEAIVARPDQPIGALPMLTDEERRRMLVQWNTPSAEDLVANLDRLGGDELDALLNDLSSGGARDRRTGAKVGPHGLSEVGYRRLPL